MYASDDVECFSRAHTTSSQSKIGGEASQPLQSTIVGQCFGLRAQHLTRNSSTANAAKIIVNTVQFLPQGGG